MKGCIQELVDAQAAKTPDAIAVSFAGQSIDYVSLARRANRLAHMLLQRGLERGALVVVHLERSLDAVVAFLGIVKAGGAYLPLDCELPEARQTLLLSQSNAALAITTRALADRLPASDLEVVILDEEPQLAAMPENAPDVHIGLDDRAYVNYTSGSSGTPKGVIIPHRGVRRLVAEPNYVTFAPHEVVLHASPLSFDATTFELWWPLAHGGRVAIFPPGPMNVQALARFLVDEKVTTAFFTTALFHELVRGHLGSLRGLRQLLTGGEVMSVADVDDARRALTQTRISNVYGPTENTTFSTFRPISASEPLVGSIPIGRAIAGTEIHVLDEELAPLPVGTIGEIVLGGEGVALGYLGREDLTAVSFPSNRFGQGRLYRTGDWGRLREDGDLEFHGRRDHQLKLRGFRVEPGEIEANLREHAAVGECVVVLDGANEDKLLVAYLTLTAAATADQLRDHLAGRLPAYMVPAIFVQLRELPRSAHGKIDRDKLPPPSEGNRLKSGAAHQSFSDDLERQMAEIWTALLSLPSVPPDEDFFASGGNSLLAIRLVTQASDRFGVTLNIAQLFSNPTVRLFSKVVREALSRKRATSPGIRCTPSFQPVREQLVSLEQAEFLRTPEVAALQGVRIEGRLDVDLFERCARAVVQRHEVLRATFGNSETGWLQRTSAEWDGFSRVDLGSLPEDERHEALERRSAADGVGFDLGRGPLFRLTVLSLSPTVHVVLLSAQHALFDGFSRTVFWDELAALYAAEQSGEPMTLAPLPFQYSDYARSQHEYLATSVDEERLAAWRRELSEVQSPDLPTDEDARSGPEGRAVIKTVLDADLVEDLRRIARAEQSSIFVLLFAAYVRLLRQRSGMKEFVVGTLYANRHHEGVDKLIGCFNQQVAMRFRELVADDWRTLFEEVRRTVMRNYANLDVNPYVAPPVRVGINFNPKITIQLPGATVTRWDRLREGEKKPWFHLSLRLEEEERGVFAAFLYDRQRFRERTVRELAECWDELLRDLVTHLRAER